MKERHWILTILHLKNNNHQQYQMMWYKGVLSDFTLKSDKEKFVVINSQEITETEYEYALKEKRYEGFSIRD